MHIVSCEEVIEKSVGMDTPTHPHPHTIKFYLHGARFHNTLPAEQMATGSGGDVLPW